jgi:hypothetical protein
VPVSGLAGPNLGTSSAQSSCKASRGRCGGAGHQAAQQHQRWIQVDGGAEAAQGEGTECKGARHGGLKKSHQPIRKYSDCQKKP